MKKILHSIETSRYRDTEKKNPMNNITTPRFSLNPLNHPISRFLSYSVMPILLSLLAGLFILTACEEETTSPKKDSPPTITITAIEDQSVHAGSSLTVSITATDAPDQTPILSYSPILPYAILTSTGNGTADLVFNPNREVDPGAITITITATSDGLTDTETFTLTVTPPDRAPTIDSITSDLVSVSIGKTTNVTVIASDPDPDDTPSFSLVNNDLDFITVDDLRNGTATINIAPLDPKTSMHVGRHRITVKATSGDLSAETNFTFIITDDDSDGDGTVDSLDVDDDNDGLIEINSLDDLHNIRHNLAGTSYKTNAMDPGNTRGATGSALKGYELTRDLDFNDPTSYERNEVNTIWARTLGWRPIGDNSTDNNSTRFSGILEGNGHKIANLIISRFIVNIGLFGYIGTNSQVRNLGLENAVADSGNVSFINYTGLLAGRSEGTIIAVHTSGIANGGARRDNVGGLVGENRGTITACYATGMTDSGEGDTDRTGGLVGLNNGTITDCHATGNAGGVNNVGGLVGQNFGTITACYATGMTDSGGDNSEVGGLVGENRGTITACYATGNAGGDNSVGGLVGKNIGTITACYATGMVDSREDDEFIRVGGLVGENIGTITACYATGNADDGGDNRRSSVGGLVGVNNGTITACYATGNADGGEGNFDFVGGLVGFNSGPITASYGFGMVTGEEFAGVDRSGDADATVGSASALTITNSSTMEANRWPARVWDFGTDSQVPVLKWITGYNRRGTTEAERYPCDVALLPAGRRCGEIIPGQGR